MLLRPLLSALPPWLETRVVTYALDGDNSYPALLAFVRNQLADLAHCCVLGWSFAGPLALMLAAAEPHKVRSVILSASFVRAPTPLLKAAPFAILPPTVWLWRAARRLPLWLFAPPQNPLRRAKSETWQRVSASVIAKRLRAIAAVDASSLLRGCRQPVLYLASSADGIVPSRNADEVRRLRPSVRFATIDGPHLAMFTNPGAAAQAIAGFIGHDAVTTHRDYRAASS